MSLYASLARPVPTIAYSALHESLPEVPREDYSATMREFHERLRSESRKLSDRYARFLEDARRREFDLLRGSLGEFLHSPLRNDEQEIHNRIGDSLSRFLAGLAECQSHGLASSTEGEVFFSLPEGFLTKKVGMAGREYLRRLGFLNTPGDASLFESVFVVQGGRNLDILEYLVRDVLGIYATTHGKHLREFGNYSYTVYNLVFQNAPAPDGIGPQDQVESAVFFSKPGPERMKYAPFRNGLVSAMKALLADIPVVHCSLWQRKLGLGSGVEFVLRFRVPSDEAVNDLVTWIDGYRKEPFVREVLIEEGRLVLKRLLY
jgi:hypothetical protein